ncbi:hypothetical protein [Paracoccus albus]|uniref:hypothetical protein n=1 Tax=Paracoccus albus TaxID=3017784 RepID=UPI0022F04E2E|nr:hypothetical protein [Paracoccus albus]WBU62048.1 hypothetical protein PAF20_17380 [Paracoccus albus]
MKQLEIEFLANGLCRAQRQLADCLPAQTRRALLSRAQDIRPSLERLREAVELEASLGNISEAERIYRQIPRFRWTGLGICTAWHDKIRKMLSKAGAELPELSGPSARLVIAFAFPPFANASGNVMARRVEKSGDSVDVISNDMSGVAPLDGGLYGAISARIGQHIVLEAENYPARAAAFTDFADATVQALQSDEFGAQRYDEIYSRSMWAQSHFAAAAAFVAGFGDSWTAEFSDPCRQSLTGDDSNALVDDAWLENSRIAAAIRARGFDVPDGQSLMFWAEYLPFCLADRIVFNNEEQRDLMGSQPDLPENVRARISSISEIEEHPVPGPTILSQMPCPKASRGDIWIGYFGNLNPRRDLTPLLNAFARLPDHLKAKLRLLVFGNVPREFRRQCADLGIDRFVIASAALDYLDALSYMRAMDWLFINDTATDAAFRTNPYLPSKLADYRSAGRPVLAFAETGSALSRTKLPPGSLCVDMTDEDATLNALIHIASADAINLQTLASETMPSSAAINGAEI